MNYSRIYEQLMRRGKQRVPQGYVERHHIIPKCMGGGDENDNLVALTPEEHFLAHVLLVKMYPEQRSLIFAVQKMTQGRSRNKMYGWLKRRFSEEMKRSQTGQGNTQFGTMWICNIVSKQNKKVPKDSSLEDGWIRGRNKWNSVCKCGKLLVRNCESCKFETRSRAMKARRNFIKGRVFYTNGDKDVRINPDTETPPQGFYRGRTFGQRGLRNARLAQLDEQLLRT